MKHNPHTENGSAIVYIFIGVALFGALMFMFSRGGTQNSQIGSSKQYDIAAIETLEYARTVEAAWNKLIAKGCSESEISSYDPVVHDTCCWDSGVNTQSPVDKSCNLFDKNGGNISYQYPSEILSTLPQGTWFAGWWFQKLYMKKVGKDECSDQTIIIPDVKREACIAINKALGYGDNVIFDNNLMGWGGSEQALGQEAFSCTSPGWFLFDTAMTAGKTAFCYDTTDTDEKRYQFLYVLHKR